MQTYAFILAGGRGERLWPLSTRHRPKQFLSLFGGKSLLQRAVDRLEGLFPADHIYVITSADLCEATRAALPTLPPEQILGEPLRRDTAAAVALACGMVYARDPEGVVAILTADHVMADEATFRTTLSDAITMASQHEAILTLGIAPTFPATTYGYIECGDELPSPGATPMRAVRRFVEKPDRDTAQAYLDTGAFLWNAGMFIWRAHVMVEAFRAHAPQWLPLIEAPDALEAHYPTLPAVSIDIALMEKCPNLMVALGDFGWDDVGNLTALAHHMPADADGNASLTPLYTHDAKGCLVLNEADTRPTALIGVSDLIVVQTPTATLICPKSATDHIKNLLPHLPDELK